MLSLSTALTAFHVHEQLDWLRVLREHYPAGCDRQESAAGRMLQRVAAAAARRPVCRRQQPHARAWALPLAGLTQLENKAAVGACAQGGAAPIQQGEEGAATGVAGRVP